MRFGLIPKATRKRLAGILLLAFAVRALVPPGFMPASGWPLSFEICPEGFPARLLAHTGLMHMDSMHMDSMHTGNHHSGRPSQTEHCVFGAACASGPTSDPSSLTGISLAVLATATPLVSAPPAVQLVHLPRARGPPIA